jgi:hypothetical protein
VSADDPWPREPGLDHLVRALTADPTAAELAGQDAALRMFRASHRRRRHRARFAYRIGVAAAAVTVAAGIAAGAYVALLPAPVQHAAGDLVDRIVADVHHHHHHHHHHAAPSPSAHPATPPPSHPGEPAVAPAPGLVLTAARPQIVAGTDDVLFGLLRESGQAAPGVPVQLFERLGGQLDWRLVGRTVTGPGGDATLAVRNLTMNASFRLAGPSGSMSQPVLVTVVPLVTIDLASGRQPQTGVVTASALFAEPGDVVVLQRLSGGIWRSISERPLDQDHLAAFTVPVPSSGHRVYQVVLPGTAAHASSVSGQVRVPMAQPGAGAVASGGEVFGIARPLGPAAR